MNKLLITVFGLLLTQASICSENKPFVKHPDFPNGTPFNRLYREPADILRHMRQYPESDHPEILQLLKTGNDLVHQGNDRIEMYSYKNNDRKRIEIRK